MQEEKRDWETTRDGGHQKGRGDEGWHEKDKMLQKKKVRAMMPPANPFARTAAPMSLHVRVEDREPERSEVLERTGRRWSPRATCHHGQSPLAYSRWQFTHAYLGRTCP